MIAILKRMFKTAWQGIKRNSWLSIACIVMMVLSLLIFSSILIFNHTVNILINTLKEKMDISIYFKTDVPEEDILKIRDELLSSEIIAKIIYVSKDEALKAFEERSKYNPTIQKALDELGENPLAASLNIKAKKTEDYNTIIESVKNSAFKDKLIIVDLAENQKVVARVDVFAKVVKVGSLFVVSILACLSFIIGFNTIRMAIYSLKEEVEIMKLVGASNWFVRGPFLLEGALQGFIASISTTIIFSLFLLALGGRIDNFIPDLGLSIYFWSHFWLIFLLQTAFGIFLGIISSFWALNHYLKI
ncbi:MAG: permease-like cell division protein FtsX [Candidatus Paceibacterota bacterium]|jgi:cell division transport system permease protein